MEQRRLLNAAPIAEDDRFEYGDLIGAGLSAFRAEAPGVLANDQDPDGDSLRAVLVDVDEGMAVRLEPDGSFVAQIAGSQSDLGFYYAATDGVTTSEPRRAVLRAGSVDFTSAVWSTAEGGADQLYVRTGVRLAERTWESLLAAVDELTFLGASGHLATITTAEENEFVAQFGSASPLIGGYQDHAAPDYQEPDGGWRWVTGEPWEYTNWTTGEPNDLFSDVDGEEDVAQLYGGPYWNDNFLRDSQYVLLEFAERGAVPGDDVFRAPLQSEMQVATQSLLANDVLGRTDLSLEIVTGPSRGTAELDAAGNLVVRPDGETPYRDRVTYRLVGDGFASPAASIWLNFGGDDWPTRGYVDAYSIEAGRTLTIDGRRWPTVLANDEDGDGLPLSAALVEPPPTGELEFRDDGSFRYVPAPKFLGRTSFTYVATDGFSVSPPIRVEIDVTANAPPSNVGRPDLYVYRPNEILSVSADEGVLVNDVLYGADDFAARFAGQRTARGGSVYFQHDGSFEYVPPPGYAGPDQFRYYPTFQGNESSLTYVSLTSDGSFLEPSGAGDAYTVDRSGTVVAAARDGVAANDLGRLDGWSVRMYEAPAHGSLQLAGDGAFTYRSSVDDPLTAINDGFSYELSDGERTQGPYRVNLTRKAIAGVRVAWPEAPGDSDREYIVASRLDPDRSTADWFLTNELAQSFVVGERSGHLLTVVDAAEQAFVAERLAPHLSGDQAAWMGAWVDVLDSAAAGRWQWATGEAFEFEAWSGETSESSRQDDFGALRPDGSWDATTWHGSGDVDFAVLEFSQFSPTVSEFGPHDDVYEWEGEFLDVPLADGLLGDRADIDEGVVVELVDGPSFGDVQLAADGSFVYSATNDSPRDSFTYHWVRGDERSAAATVWLRAQPPRAPVEARRDVYFGVEDEILFANVTAGVAANDEWELGAEWSVQVVEPPESGELLLHADGSFVYRPAPGFHGETTFSYAISDGVTEDVGEVRLHFRAVVAPPIATPDHYEFAAGTELVVAAVDGVLANDIDVTGAGISALLVEAPQYGVLKLALDGSFLYSPDDDVRRDDQFTYQTLGADGAVSPPQTATLSGLETPTVAAAIDDVFRIDGSDLLTGDVLAQERLAAEVQAALVSPPQHGRIELLASGEFRYAVDGDFSGVDEFTYAVIQPDQSLGYARAEIHTVRSDVTATPFADVRVRPRADGEPGVAYALVEQSGDPPVQGWNWGTSNSLAQRLVYDGTTGRLATPATVEEWEWLVEHVGDSGWLGAFQNLDSPDYLEPDLGWEWISGEDWSEPSWALGHPDDGLRGADHLAASGGEWIDQDRDARLLSFFVEFPGEFGSPLTGSDDVYSLEVDGVLQSAADDGVLANDAFLPEGWILEVVDGPRQGLADVAADGGFEYRPNAGFSGVDRFTYRLVGDETATNVATAWLVVGAAPPPEAVSDEYFVFEDESLTTGVGTVHAVDFVDGVIPDWLDVSSQFFVEEGVLHNTSSRGEARYDASVDAAEFLWQVNFSTSSSFQEHRARSFRIGLEPRDVALNYDSNVSIVSETGVHVYFRRGPSDRIAASASAAGAPLSLGSFSVGATASVRFWKHDDSVAVELDEDFDGVFVADHAHYFDHLGESAGRIEPDKLQPFIQDAYGAYAVAGMIHATPGGLGLLENDRWLGDSAEVVVVKPPAHGVLEADSSGGFTYTADPNFYGTDEFHYEVISAGRRSGAATATIHVGPRPEAITPRDDEFSAPTLSPVVAARRVLRGGLSSLYGYDASRNMLWLMTGSTPGSSDACDAGGPLCDEYSVVIWDIAANRAVASFPGQSQSIQSPFSFNDDYSLVRYLADGAWITGNVDDVLRGDWDFRPAEAADDGARFGYRSLAWHPSGRFAIGENSSGSLDLVRVDGDDVFETPLALLGPESAWGTWRRLHFRHGMVSTDGENWWLLDESNDRLEHRAVTPLKFSGVELFQGPTAFGLHGRSDSQYFYSRDDASLVVWDRELNSTASIAVGGAADETWLGAIETDDRLDDVLLVTWNGVYSLDLSQRLDARFDLLANDLVEPDFSEYAILVDPPSHGSVVLGRRGEATYFPDPGFVGDDVFTYRVAKHHWTSEIAVATVHVQPAEAPGEPIARTDGYTVYGDELVVGADVGVLDNDSLSDVEFAVLVEGPAHGTISLAENGGFHYAPDEGFFGEDRFRYAVSRGGELGPSAEAILSVRPRYHATVVFVDSPTKSLLLAEAPSSLAHVALGDVLAAELWVRNLDAAPAGTDVFVHAIEYDADRLSAFGASQLGWFDGLPGNYHPSINRREGRIEELAASAELSPHIGDGWVRVGFSMFTATAAGRATAATSVQFPYAYEGNRHRLDMPTTELLITSPADANGDGAVDLADFNIMKTNFGSTGDRSRGDVDGDGVVDLADFSILKAAFGFRINADDDADDV